MTPSFFEFVENFNLKNQAASKIKIREVLKELGLKTHNLKRGSKVKTICRILNLHPTRGTHWIL